MASKAITLQVRPRGKPLKTLPETIDLPANATADEIYSTLSRATKLPVYQLRVTKGSDGNVVQNAKKNTVHSTGLRDQSTIYVKDLGTQIGWRTVYIIEYIGPLFIHPLMYALRPYVYPSAPEEASQLQTITLWLLCIHFLKRELETIFVHRFSAPSMPIFNLFRNSAYYWVLSGLVVGAFLYAPSSAAAKEPNPALLYPGLAVFTLGEAANLSTHLTLRGLRSAGGTERGIPQGFLFRLVTSPNYLTEVISWVGICLVSGGSWGVVIFTVVATWWMWGWAKQRERRYRAEFGDKYKKKRYTILPGLL